MLHHPLTLLSNHPEDSFVNSIQRFVLEAFMELLICGIIGCSYSYKITPSDLVAQATVGLCFAAIFFFVAFGIFFVFLKSCKMVSA